MSATCSNPAICTAFCLPAESFEPGGGSELGGIDLFTGSPENTPAQRVDGLAVEDNFGRQPRNGSVPTGDLIVQVLSFGVFNY